MGVPVFGPLARKIFGTRNQRMVRRYLRIVDAVNALEAQTRLLTDSQLRDKVAEFRKRLHDGEAMTAIMPEAFAIAREAMDRSVGLRNIFDPALGFDPTQLPSDAQALHAGVLREIAAASPREPKGDLRCCGGPVAPWQFVEIPPALYEAVRVLYQQSRPPFRARPFDVQIIGGIVLSEGRIAEMKTGEGKTIVAPLAAYLAAIEGQQVHVVTVNDYLVQRDRNWTFPFFHAVGLTVGAIHPYHMQGNEGKREAYSCDVVYGTTAEFGFDYLRDNMKVRLEDQVQRRRHFAIVDEVDSTLIDEARTPLIISGPAHQVQPRYDLANKLAKHLVQAQSAWNTADETVSRIQAELAGVEGDIRNVRDRAGVPALKKSMDEIRKRLRAAEHDRDKNTQFYEVELDKRRATITREGIAEAQRVANIGSFYVGENMDVPHLLDQAVRSHTVYQRDRDYVVAPDEDGQLGVVIVDQNTGRKMIGRQWSEGLHQAVEAKEGVRIKEETQTMATVTIQNFFKLYKRLAGMTGTADTEATEFHEIYRLDVVSIPTNVPVVRTDRQDFVFLSQKDKWKAVVDEIEHFHDIGRPVLVGTTSVEKSETLSRMLKAQHNVPHEVLNAKQHEREADIVAGAGRLGAVMVATNMAGRGTDIKLTRFTLAEVVDHWKRRGLAPREADAAQGDEAVMLAVWRFLAEKRAKVEPAIAKAMSADDARLACLRAWCIEHRDTNDKKAATMSAAACESELDQAGGFMLHRLRSFTSAADMGGLHIVGTERHESRRIDNQLRGRSGRQGDSGSSRFFLALDDDLMKMFAGKATLGLISRLGMREGDVMENPMLTRAVEKAQRKVEERNFQIRKNILEYDEPMEHQRRSFYGMRQKVLEGAAVKDTIFEYIVEAVNDASGTYLSPLHGPKCISEWIWEKFGVLLDAERFKGKDAEDLLAQVRIDTVEEGSTIIHTTVGEYMSLDSEPADWDAAGFVEWAQRTYGAVIDPQIVRDGKRDEAVRLVDEAMARKWAAIDITPLAGMIGSEFGERAFLQWAERKFGVPFAADTLEGMQTPEEGAARVVEAARRAYAEREIVYPIDFAMEFTTANLQANPQTAIAQFCSWARSRYEVNWTPEALPSADPRELRALLLAEARLWDAARVSARAGRIVIAARSAGGEQGVAVAEAIGREALIRLTDEERQRAATEPEAVVTERLRDALRTELSHFERWVLLQVYDQSWKDHLHGMDQMRDAIGFRSFSQKDPRIEFRRESARLFNEMHVAIRDKVTDLVFKGRLTPQVQRPAPVAQVAAAGAAAPAAAAAPVPEAPAPSATQARDIAIAERAGSASSIVTGSVRRMTPAPKAGAVQAVGRNEPCPCGSGKKYKKCHGAKAEAEST